MNDKVLVRETGSIVALLLQNKWKLDAAGGQDQGWEACGDAVVGTL